MAAMPGLFGLLVGQTVHALSFGLSHLAAVRWVAELSPENAKISGQAWLTSASGGYGSAIGLVLAGQLADWDQHKLPYLVAAALAALGWLAARAAVRAAALTAKPRSDRESA
jgi:MFS family permease